RSAEAVQAAATKEFERQKKLFAQDYISQAALDRAEAKFKQSQAESQGQLAQAAATQTQAGYFVIRAPYDGVVADVPATVGDMAQPGRALVSYYDPVHLRVTVFVPESASLSSLDPRQCRIEISSLGQVRWLQPTYVKVLPTADPVTHTVQVRLGLSGESGLLGRPGAFVRAWLPGQASQGSKVRVPLAAVVYRAEMTGVYVINAQGQPLLRQVRLGRTLGTEVEVLSGLDATERVAPDAQTALTQAR
ncbi:MAG: efflux RND transporter periplasmic adaptor subunit, partial [Ferrovum sp.]|nr:efflux RND transporter periplasmic adaptor subunit [Ferrovum sp.]